MIRNFSGIITALATPFSDQGVDYDVFERFVEWQITSGVHGLVPCATTGECATISHDEYVNLIAKCVSVTDSRVPVIAGTGLNNTTDTIAKTQLAEKLGVDAALIIAPYYNKPVQQGIFEHFKMVHDNTNLPIIVYNVPSRTVIDIHDETIAKLLELPRIVGLKDATGDLGRLMHIKRLTEKLDKRLFLLSGDDHTALAFKLYGGSGCISVISNVLPSQCVEIYRNCIQNNYEHASQICNSIMPLIDAIYIESNPIPVKYALSLLGLGFSDKMRLPLTSAGEKCRRVVDESLKPFILTSTG